MMQTIKFWGAGVAQWRELSPPSNVSRTRRHTGVEFVVGSLLCSEGFFSRYAGFPLSENQHSKFQLDLGMQGQF